jgi:hypothetical protein
MNATVLQIARIALELLSDRALTFLALFMTFGLASWAMYAPSYERLGIAAFFALIVFVPTLRMMSHKETDDGKEQA